MRLDGFRRHQVAPHPVTHDLQISAAQLSAIASRHRGAVEQHQADLPLLHPSGKRQSRRVPADEAMQKLAENGTWLTLFGVQDDPLLRPIADEVQELVGPGVDVVLSLICSSSGGVTPAHMDVHDVLLLQLQGRKRFGTGAFTRRSAADAELRRRFGPDRENLRELPDQQQEWPLEPGTGVVVPAYTPHWAFVEDEVSIALSIATSTPALRRREAVHRIDAAMLRRRVRLPAPGRLRVLDEARFAMAAMGRRLR